MTVKEELEHGMCRKSVWETNMKDCGIVDEMIFDIYIYSKGGPFGVLKRRSSVLI
jgi:hypothetical protein